MKPAAPKRRRPREEPAVVRQPDPALWCVVAPKGTGLSLEAADPAGAFAALAPGDALLLADAAGPSASAWGLRRVYLARLLSGGKTEVWFDRAVDFPAPVALPGGAKNSPARLDISLLDPWLVGMGLAPFADLAPPADTPAVRGFIRTILEQTVRDDLLGPAGGPEEEIVGMNVRDRYVVGRLAPCLPRETDGGAAAGPGGETGGFDGADAVAEPDLDGNEHHLDRDGVPASDVSEEEADEAVVDENSMGGDGGEPDPMRSGSLVPSSMGLTFCVDASLPDIEVSVAWGSYRRATSETKVDDGTQAPLPCWKRMPFGGTKVLHLAEGIIAEYPGDDRVGEITVTGSVSAPVEGVRLVTLFLVNRQTEPKKLRDAAWVFQPEIRVRAADGVSPVFRKRPLPALSKDDPELKALDMIYRRSVEFAVGHNVAVHAVVPEGGDPGLAIEVRTEVVPRYEVPTTEVPGGEPGDRVVLKDIAEKHLLDMRAVARDVLAGGGANVRSGALGRLVDDYGAWIADRRVQARNPELAFYRTEAAANLDRCETIHRRLEEGLSVLERDENARKAFAFANDVMADQRVHSIYAGRRRNGKEADLDDIERNPASHEWRPFQIAFLLLAVPALSDPSHADRTESATACADLLWFPTGGGKTEAYLGVAAFAMAIRRLQGDLGGLDASRGLSVVMRYTLRLLTVQQFQRASTMMCAMERRRRADVATWGVHPFTLGLWVGGKITPNNDEEAKQAVDDLRNDRGPRSGASPAQLASCPWCGAPIDPKSDIDYEKDEARTVLYCSDHACAFSARQNPGRGLPVVVVDSELYRRPPSMMIATADKFAQMAWNGAVRTLFGRVGTECERHGFVLPDSECNGNHLRPRTQARTVKRLRPPDLVIQDEFHLISGPLGTLVGLYETAVDELCAWSLPDGRKARPKVIASTATVRMADEQMNRVFYRRCSVFPPAGLDVADNFFSVRRDTKSRSGRLYMGVCALGLSRPAALIRVYTAFLTAAQTLFEGFGRLADPYMTAVGYFNSLRELGGMRRLAEDDVQTRSYRVLLDHRIARPGLSQRRVTQIDELTSRVNSRDIPAKLAQLEIEFSDEWKPGEPRAIDVELATNMLSVGVDVDRLGLMIANGQPKNTAEYIQATSRVGRRFPGLVCTVLAWAKPRDFSHYESFEHYHATFYKQVEAQSVTPFAARALDRGLTGAFVSRLRLGDDSFAPNAGAAVLTAANDARAVEARKEFVARAENVMADTGMGRLLDEQLDPRLDRWAKEATEGNRNLVFKKPRHSRGTEVPLLREPGLGAWDRQTAPTSMREVEGDIRLIMKSGMLPAGTESRHPWQPRPDRAAADGDENGGTEAGNA